jgi:hypothetical protein
MSRGGKRAGAGRRVGSHNKVNAELGRTLTEFVRPYTREMLDCLVGIARDKKASASARAFAASQVLDRGWGRPTQQVEHSGEIDHTISARLDAALRRIAGRNEN